MPPRPRPLLVLAVACATAAVACSRSARIDAGAFDAGGDGGDLSDLLDDFFRHDVVHAIRIDVDEEGVASLLEMPRIYVEGSVRVDDSLHGSVGVRLKGGAGSFVALDGDYPEISGDGNGKPGKSAFIVDFNRYVDGRSHLGLEKLTLNNLVQDPSCIHELLGYSLFREGNVAASRSGFAIVTFNGEEKGLYALVETPDNDEFLDRWFGTNDGNLYEGEYGTDLRPEAVDRYDQDNGDDESRSDLRDLAETLDAIGPDEDPIHVLEGRFDLPEYLTFAATELYLGHWDGYAWSANNYAIHHDPVRDRWSFLPWGIDQIFEADMGRFAGVMRERGPSWGPESGEGGGGRVHALCFESAECRSRLHQAFEDLLDRVDTMDLGGLADEARNTVQDLALAESTAYGDPRLTIESLDRVSAFIRSRREAIESWLPCLAGRPIDHDRDSHDGCTTDCDDGNPNAHPGATEECNLFDDDCDGLLDEPLECPRCFEEPGPGGGEYSFCFDPTGWEDARQTCLDRGQDLTSIHDDREWDLVTFRLMEVVPVEGVWIGLSDRDAEGAFAWTDGSALDYEHWAPEHPRREGEVEDCVASAPWGWQDVFCDEARPFVCKAP